MIKKTLLQGVIIGACIFGLWAALSQVDFMRLFKVDKVSDNTEQKLGDLFWKTIQNTETIIRNDSVNKYVDRIVTQITSKNGINRDKIKVHIVQKDEANAFALPGDHLIVYTGLINSCDNEAELAGVIGHEIAHIEKRHVMKKLVKELGLSIVISMTTGGRGSHAASEAIKTLSSSAYDRKLETEADLTSVDYMMKADINPLPFADLLYKMSTEVNVPSAVYWLSTHPESAERAKEIVSYIKDQKPTIGKRVLTSDEWKFLKDKSKY
jgi:predicted Zn-dependent protease